MIRPVSGILPILVLACAFVVCVQIEKASCADVVYAYDALNRLVSATFDDGRKIRYTYDSAGNIVKEAVVLTVDSPGDTPAEAGEESDD